MRIKIAVITLFTVLFSVLTWAASSPLTMLQNTSDQMLAALQQNKASLKSDPQVVYGIINRILLPHMDIEGMSRSVLGRDAWAQATPAQRQQFTQQFTTLLIHTYSSAFAQYNNQTVKFFPIRGDVSGQSRVQVNSSIVRPDGPAIAVNYRLILLGGEWKVYDFSVEGVSMLQSFSSQFAQQLSQGGIAGVIQQLTRHNANSTSR